MISYNRVFEEMERQLMKAKHADNPNDMREALAAIRSLTEVALGGKNEIHDEMATNQIATPQAQPVQSLNSLEAAPLEEDGANGSSLFDF
ncbi:YwdI family protein [Sporosarcina pasteurii]|uniref:YwdI family protein n=1 Tax=Sporosarcina pasteurii TaxID=1474 RepID=A0A380BC98_SPOPA|nr:YwdI family protein [Sporosarcina pasteurii]MDS9472334.1 YwdI family protein [Sporosarcina pasteurii]QBQ06313.1 uracil-DNA glycosylase [Sporosarcina pasteurii]SUI98966.1 Uncharacterised protein [Sporosarcina pasteurii]